MTPPPPANDDALRWRLAEVFDLGADGQFKRRLPTAEDRANAAWARRRPRP